MPADYPVCMAGYFTLSKIGGKHAEFCSSYHEMHNFL